VLYSGPKIVDSVVFVGSLEGVLSALDAKTGDALWHFSTGNTIYRSAVVSNGMAFVSSQDQGVHALDAATGEEQWHFDTENSFDSSTALVDNVLYLGAGNGTLYAVDAASGQEAWQYVTGDPIHDVLIVEGVAYVANRNATVYAISTTTGQELWRFGAGVTNPSRLRFVDDTVFFGIGDTISWAICAVNAASGNEVWRFTQDEMGDPDFPMFFDAVVEGIVYTTNVQSSIFHAIHQHSGAEVWRLVAEDVIRSSPSLAGAVAYVGSLGGVLYAVDRNTGENLRSFAAGSSIIFQSVSPAGDVYVGASDGYVHALDI
jgi:outer membrane protein assembly factor BamB